MSEAAQTTIPGALVGSAGKGEFILRVVGDSLIEEGINDGDYVICERVLAAEPGDMAVVLVNGERTLKLYYQEGDAVRLQPANPRLQAIRLPASEVSVEAIVVGLMRRYLRGGGR